MKVRRLSPLPLPSSHPSLTDAGFFVFPDLSVRTEGSYRLKLSLFEVVGYVSDPPFSRFVSASFLIQFQ